MRTVYLGTSEFAATVLDELAASAHRPQLVVTRPDAPRGRGRKLAPPPVAETRAPARHRGLPAGGRERRGGAGADRRRGARRRADLRLRRAHQGAASVRPQMLNVHPSLLPRWRGAAPIERAIEAGDEETGVTIMQPTAELDAGPIAVQRAEAIRPDDDYGSLSARLAALGGELLVEALDLEPALPRAARHRRDLRREDRPGGPPARPAAHRRPPRAPRAGASPAHRRLRRAAMGRAAGRDARGARARAPRRAVARPARRRATAGFSTAPPAARWSSARCTRRASGRWTPSAWIRGYGERLET